MNAQCARKTAGKPLLKDPNTYVGIAVIVVFLLHSYILMKPIPNGKKNETKKN